jgi:hypothetical protein
MAATLSFFGGLLLVKLFDWRAMNSAGTNGNGDRDATATATATSKVARRKDRALRKRYGNVNGKSERDPSPWTAGSG